MGELQGQTGADVRADGRAERWLLQWHAGAPGGESHAESVARALAVLRHWDVRSGDVPRSGGGAVTLVVAHGALIRDVLGLVDGESIAVIPGASATPNCAPIRREIIAWPVQSAADG